MGLSAALAVSGGATPDVYLIKGTWAARYTKDNGSWRPTGPFPAPLHVTTWWPGLGTTAGRREYSAAWTASKRIWLTAGNDLVRYDIAQDKVISSAGEKLTGQIAGLPEGFKSGVDAAFDAGRRVYLFKGAKYCSVVSGSVSGGVKTLSGMSGVDAALFVDGKAYLFSGDTYRTATASEGTVTVDSDPAKKITDTWPGAPLGTPMLDLYCIPQTKLVRIRTNIDLTSGGTTFPTKLTHPVTELKFGWSQSDFEAVFHVTPDNRRAYLSTKRANAVYAVDLTKDPSQDAKLWEADLKKSVSNTAVSRDWQHLYALTGLQKFGQLARIRLGDKKPEPTLKAFANPYRRLVVAPDGKKVYVGYFEGSKPEFQLGVVDATTLVKNDSVDLNGVKPDQLVMTPDGSRVYVGTVDQKGVRRIKIDDPMDGKTFGVAGRVVDLAMTLDGTLCVAAANLNDLTQRLLFIDVQKDTQTSFDFPAGTKSICNVIVDPHTRFAYVSEAEAHKIWIVDIAKKKVVDSITLPSSDDWPYRLQFAPRWV